MSAPVESPSLPLLLEVENEIAILTFDLPGERVNKLSRDVMRHFAEVLERLERRQDIKGAIIASRKDGVFIAGADVSEIATVTDGDAAAEASRQGQALMDRVERLAFPVVAAIGGVCLGGGVELALACDGRVGSDHPKFQMGLPEVNLGIVPAWGGCTRLPRLVGLEKAIEIILPGRPVDARKALRLGLVDRAVAHPELHERALELLRDLMQGKRVRGRQTRGQRLKRWLLEKNPLGRAVLFRAARKRVLSQTKGHYPAPLAALDVMRRGRRSRKRSFELEAEVLRELLPGEICRNLVRLFFLNEAAKKSTGVSSQAHAALTPHRVDAAGLLGAGTMGGGIARLLAAKAIPVRLKDVSPEAIGLGLQAARAIFEKRRRRRRLSAWELERNMSLISPTLDWTGFKQVDVVLEAIVENLDVKKSVLAETEGVVSESCILATNTSTLSVSAMQQALSRPERMAGFHFFNPVDRMPLIEVIRGDRTEDQTVLTLVALAKRLGKTPVVVKDGPGFLVNRILGPYLNEATLIFEETGDIAALDRLFVAFGMPMGPLRLLDEVGLDVAVKAGKVLADAFGDRARPSSVLDKRVSDGRLGKKNRRGFYRYEGSKEAADPGVAGLLDAQSGPLDGKTATARALGLMAAEACRCLDEGIVSSPGELDLAMIMGTGFPPFRGGLLRYVDARGASNLLDELHQFQETYGARFEPPQFLIEHVAAGKPFFSEGPRPATVD